MRRLKQSVCLSFPGWVLPPMMNSPVYFSVVDHTPILQGGNMQTASAAPHGLCEICRGCVGDRHILFNSGNKANLSRQTVWWLGWHTGGDHLDDAIRENSLTLYSRLLSAFVNPNMCKLRFWQFGYDDAFWFKHHKYCIFVKVKDWQQFHNYKRKVDTSDNLCCLFKPAALLVLHRGAQQWEYNVLSPVHMNVLQALSATP